MASMLQAFYNKGLVHGGVNSKTILAAEEDKSPVMYGFGSFSYFEHRQAYQELVSETLLFSWEISGRIISMPDIQLKFLIVRSWWNFLGFIHVNMMPTKTKGVKHYSFDQLIQITECLKSTTFVCCNGLGKLHRGIVQNESGRRDVLVMTWE
ncbi:uncharacterized protein [Primulina huaijiensis]